MRNFSLLVFLALTGTPSFAQKAQMKIEDIKADGDTTITVRKGEKALPEKNYEIISGTDEISGDEEFDSKRALASWKEACDTWKKEIRELNTDNRVLVISCGAKKKATDGTKTTYTSSAHYKIRVKMRD
jgi:hypothetical protein